MFKFIMITHLFILGVNTEKSRFRRKKCDVSLDDMPITTSLVFSCIQYTASTRRRR